MYMYMYTCIVTIAMNSIVFTIHYAVQSQCYPGRDGTLEMPEKVLPIVQVEEDDVVVLFVDQLGQHLLPIVFGALLLTDGRSRTRVIPSTGRLRARRSEGNAASQA